MELGLQIAKEQQKQMQQKLIDCREKSIYYCQLNANQSNLLSDFATQILNITKNV